MKNIVLIGMRGSGKSSVAQVLAKRLHMRPIELDKEIEKKEGMSIKKMVASHGWDYFRARESGMVSSVASQRGAVISTGGGAVLRSANVSELKRGGICIYLRASVDTLAARLGEAPHLPRLTQEKNMRAELTKVWKERKELYERVADEIVDTENLSLERVVEEILLLLKKRRI